ncbi:MAG: terminase small subunit [Gammaproteobacteria bacterium]
MGYFCNKAELAELLEVSERSLTTWQNQGMPIYSQGQRGQENAYRVKDVVDWMVAREVGKAIGLPGDEPITTLDKEKTRLTRAQAEKTELEVATLRGDLIPSDTVMRVQGGMVSAFRARALALPSKMAPQVIGLDEKGAEAVLTDAVHEALDELGDFDPTEYVSPDRKAGEAAASDDGESVGGREKGDSGGGRRRARKVANK